MTPVTDAPRCPRCGFDHLSRRRRSLWMRLLPGSRKLRCDRCYTEFLWRPGSPSDGPGSGSGGESKG